MMIDLQLTTAFAYYHSAPPAEALRFLQFRCEQTVDLINRSGLTPGALRELSSMWLYISSIGRYLGRKWAADEKALEEDDLHHIHYIMVPRLLREYIPKTGDYLNTKTIPPRLQSEYARIWRFRSQQPIDKTLNNAFKKAS